jgi:hypothetical protein
MVKESGALIEGAAGMLDSCAARDRERFNDGLRILVGALSKVNTVMNSECALLYHGARYSDGRLCYSDGCAKLVFLSNT